MKLVRLLSAVSMCVLFISGVLVQTTVAENAQQASNQDTKQTFSPYKKFVLNFSNEVINVKNSNLSPAEAKARFVDIANRYVATENISKFLLAANYRKLSEENKEKVQICVRNLMATRLLAELPHGESITTTITAEKALPHKHWMITVEYFVDGKKYEVIFSIFDTKHGPQIFDVIINGVSASKIQRADIDGNIAEIGFNKFLEKFFATYAN
jgi:ABC-type transporter MlaC component